ncbi:MAG: lipid-binding SYLF domain-containing protein [Pseudomonadota bacterium]
MRRERMGRRSFLGSCAGALGGAALVAGAPSAAEARSAAEIDLAAADALSDLYRVRPAARGVAERSFGALIVPDIVKAGFIVGASYGEGALIIGGRTDSYWSYTAGSIGLQAGAQRTRLALFFMGQEALDGFLRSDGVEMGVDAEVTLIDGGADMRLDTTRGDGDEIIAFVFGRAGLLGGASYSGGKYRRLAR